MVDNWPGNEANGHESEYADRSDREDRGESLTLAERCARVTDQPQGEQSAEQSDRRTGIELTDRDDLGDDIKGQPGDGHDGPQQPQSQR